MISLLGIILLIVYVIGLFSAYSAGTIRFYKEKVLIGGIIISLFINLGNFILNFSFSEVASVICIVTCIVTTPIKENHGVRFSKSILMCFVLLILSILIGFAYCSLRKDMPYVLAMYINMDHAYYGLVDPVRASITEYNSIAFMDLLLFSLVLIAYRKELQDRDTVGHILNSIRNAFHLLFLAATFEFILNNFVSPQLLRNITTSLVGSFDRAKTYYPENRFGYYGIALMFSEQSYIAILSIYYAIVWKLHVNNNKELGYFILSIAVLIMSGCSTGIVMLPLALIVFLRECLKKRQRSMIRLAEWMFVLVVFLGGACIIVTHPSYFAEYLNSTILKIGALIKGGQYINNAVLASGATRNYANALAVEAFFSSPLFGVGIGGTRAYGIWTAFAATFGIVGMVAFVAFLNNIFGFRLKGKVILVVLLSAYFSIILSIWYLYMLAFIPIYLCLSRD